MLNIRTKCSRFHTAKGKRPVFLSIAKATVLPQAIHINRSRYIYVSHMRTNTRTQCQEGTMWNGNKVQWTRVNIPHKLRHSQPRQMKRSHIKSHNVKMRDQGSELIRVESVPPVWFIRIGVISHTLETDGHKTSKIILQTRNCNN
jgi:hypothetical protein